MIPGHPRIAGDRPAAGRPASALPTVELRPRHHMDAPQSHGSCLAIAIPIAIVIYALAIVGALHLVASVLP